MHTFAKTADNSSGYSYKLMVNGTVVRLRFSGSESLNSRLANAFILILNKKI